MIRYCHTLVDKKHCVKTIVLLLLSIAFIIGAVLLSVDDSILGKILLIAGSLSLIATFTYALRNALVFFILGGISAGLVVLSLFAVKFYETQTTPVFQSFYNGYVESVLTSIILYISLPGVIIGLVGGLYWGAKEKKEFESFQNDSRLF